MTIGPTPYAPYLSLLVAQFINTIFGCLISNTAVTLNSFVNLLLGSYYISVWYIYAPAVEKEKLKVSSTYILVSLRDITFFL